MRHKEGKDILWIYGMTRILLLFITYTTFILFTAAGYSSTPVNTEALLTTWKHGDVTTYLRIAHYGYKSANDLIFFPLFPLLIAGGAWMMGGWSWSYLLVGTLISNLALSGALFLIWRLITDLTDDKTAERVILYLCLSPAALFFFAALNGSLLLFCTCATLLALQHQKWWLAGITGMLAALTGLNGILLMAPFLVVLWQQRKNISGQTLLINSGALFCIPLGTFLYAVYSWQITGNAFTFLAGSQARLLDVSSLFYMVSQPASHELQIWIDGGTLLGYSVSLGMTWKRLPGMYTIWMGCGLVTLYLHLLLTGSDTHYMITQTLCVETFPLLLLPGTLGIYHPRFHTACLSILSTFLTIFSIAFVITGWTP